MWYLNNVIKKMKMLNKYRKNKDVQISWLKLKQQHYYLVQYVIHTSRKKSYRSTFKTFNNPSIWGLTPNKVGWSYTSFFIYLLKYILILKSIILKTNGIVAFLLAPLSSLMLIVIQTAFPSQIIEKFAKCNRQERDQEVEKWREIVELVHIWILVRMGKK